MAVHTTVARTTACKVLKPPGIHDVVVVDAMGGVVCVDDGGGGTTKDDVVPAPNPCAPMAVLKLVGAVTLAMALDISRAFTAPAYAVAPGFIKGFE